MAEQLLVIGLGIGDDADSAWLLSGLALDGAGGDAALAPLLASSGLRVAAMTAASGKRAATLTARSGKRVEQED